MPRNSSWREKCSFDPAIFSVALCMQDNIHTGETSSEGFITFIFNRGPSRAKKTGLSAGNGRRPARVILDDFRTQWSDVVD
jgi:hypothetical protein